MVKLISVKKNKTPGDYDNKVFCQLILNYNKITLPYLVSLITCMFTMYIMWVFSFNLLLFKKSVSCRFTGAAAAPAAKATSRDTWLSNYCNTIIGLLVNNRTAAFNRIDTCVALDTIDSLIVVLLIVTVLYYKIENF